MRVSELTGLDIDDVDLRGKRCTVLGKGGKTRECYFSDVSEMYLRQYLDQRSDRNPALFVSLSKREGGYQRISKSCVEKMVRDTGIAAGVPKTHPHRFRRTMATRNLRRGMPAETIQKLLGHEDVSTTMIYAISDKSSLEHEARRLMG